MSLRLVERMDASIVEKIAPTRYPAKNQKAIIEAFGKMLPDILTEADAVSELRIAHLLAQAGHESDGFATLVEYASGAAYEGRKDLGNVETGDGRRFKGHGLIQLTGRANHRAFTIWARKRNPRCPDFEKEPELVATWPWAGWALAYYWSSRPGLNAAADRGDLIAVTKIVNGGRNGLADRAQYLSKATIAVTRIAGDLISANQQFPTLYRGMSGELVEQLQRALAHSGFYLLSIDGIFGPGTEAAVKAYQRARGLVVDGIVGAKTAAVLEPARFK